MFDKFAAFVHDFEACYKHLWVCTFKKYKSGQKGVQVCPNSKQNSLKSPKNWGKASSHTHAELIFRQPGNGKGQSRPWDLREGCAWELTVTTVISRCENRKLCSTWTQSHSAQCQSHSVQCQSHSAQCPVSESHSAQCQRATVPRVRQSQCPVHVSPLPQSDSVYLSFIIVNGQKN